MFFGGDVADLTSLYTYIVLSEEKHIVESPFECKMYL